MHELCTKEEASASMLMNSWAEQNCWDKYLYVEDNIKEDVSKIVLKMLTGLMPLSKGPFEKASEKTVRKV
jgi:hypothetical protein